MTEQIFRLSEEINQEINEEDVFDEDVEDIVDHEVTDDVVVESEFEDDVDDVVDMNEFVVIDEFENYECNRLGQIRNARTHKILKPRNNGKGYHQIGLMKDGKQHFQYVHRLIAKTFIPNPSNYQEVDHINRCKDDNNVHNLRWVTSSMNNFNRDHGQEVERIPIGAVEIPCLRDHLFEGLFYYNCCFYKDYESIVKCYQGYVNGRQKKWKIYDVENNPIVFSTRQFLIEYPQFREDFYPTTNE